MATLNARLRRVHERITSNNPRMVQVLESIRQEPVLQNDFVEALAEQEGFDPLWMTQDAPDAKVKAAAKAKTGQQSLPKMMAAAAASQSGSCATQPTSCASTSACADSGQCCECHGASSRSQGQGNSCGFATRSQSWGPCACTY